MDGVSDSEESRSPLAAEPPANAAAAEGRYRTLFDHAQVGILLADNDSRYLDANAMACRILGYGREELIGLHARDIVVAAEAGQLRQAIDEACGTPPDPRPWRLRRKDGSVFLAEVIATPLPDGTVLGTIRDLSDHERAETMREYLAAIVESSADGIVAEDLDGRIRSWNAGAEAIYGYSADEMIGRTIDSLVPEERRAESDAIQGRLAQGERVGVIETQRRRKDGRLIDISMTTSPILNAEGRMVGTSKSVRDITVLRRQERELARISRLYAALSQINQAIFQIETRDALFAEVCRVLVEKGEFCLAWIGWHDPVSNRLVPVAQNGEDRGILRGIEITTDGGPRSRGPSGTAFREARTIISNDSLAHPSARPWYLNFLKLGVRSSAAIPIRFGGRVEGTLNVYSSKRDVFHDKDIKLLEEAAADLSFGVESQVREEARREAEQRLRAEKNFSDTMIESLPGILYFYDGSGRFLRWNRNFEIASGYSAAEIAGMNPLDFFPIEDRGSLQNQIAEVFATGEASVEANFLRRDGSTRPYLFTGRRVEMEGRLCLVGAGIDISAQKREEAERELRTQAEAADRVKSAFLATMSHELRTPLNSIIGFTGILLQGLPGPLNAEQAKQLGMVRSSARHLLALVNDVLDISKIEAGQLRVEHERYEPRRSIERVLGLVIPQAQAKGLELISRVAADLDAAIGDARRFEQILLNLLSNAIKFTEHGTVTLTAERLPSQPTAARPEGEPCLRIAVADTGIGLRDEDMVRLFQPFRQIASGLSRNAEGTGLGLAICRRLAFLMGGGIDVESRWGQGSVFRVTLPLEGSKEHGPDSAHRRQSSESLSGDLSAGVPRP